MNRIIGLLIVSSLTGCFSERSPVLRDYRCSSEQLETVKNELMICEEAGYYATYCYATLRSLHCDNVKGEE